MIETTIFSPISIKTPKKGKYSKNWKVQQLLLVVLRLLIIVGRLFITIIIVGRSMRGSSAKSG
jgi:hypothetical protein